MSYCRSGRKRSLIGPVVLVTSGMLSLFEELRWTALEPYLAGVASGDRHNQAAGEQDAAAPPPCRPDRVRRVAYTSDAQPPPTSEVRNG